MDLQGLILGKNIISLGNSVYSGKGLCIEPRNIDQLKKIIFGGLNSEILDDEILLRAKRKDFISKVIANNHISFKNNFLRDIQLSSLKNQIQVKLNG